jgi:uncharacterized spore protein YtfJ
MVDTGKPPIDTRGGSVGEAPFQRAMSTVDSARDALSVNRVFGEAYQLDGVTVIPVAVVRGGGGGGGGEGTGPEGGKEGSGSGAGMGFGVNTRPVGVYVVKDGEVEWQPTFDLMRAILGGQIVAIVALLTLRKIFRRH